jgi:cytochrome c biogenesis protein CcmG/thiol:disulfide interchange protein DsbE
VSSRWTLWLPVGLFVALLGLFALQLSREKDEFVHSAMIGKPMPAFELRAATADRPGLAQADLADGTPKLMNVFASWCVPCIAEAPQLAELERAGAPIVGVAIRDRPEDLARFLAQNGKRASLVGSWPAARRALPV